MDTLIPLSGARGRGLFAVVDAVAPGCGRTVAELASLRWCLLVQSGRRGVVPHEVRRGWRRGRPGTESLHRAVMGFGRGDPPVDHVDGDVLNCRLGNLRVAGRQRNRWNSGKTRTWRGRPCSSRFKGVSLDGRGKWAVACEADGVRHRMGRFDDELAAAQAYDEKAVELFGPFARTNKSLGLL